MKAGHLTLKEIFFYSFVIITLLSITKKNFYRENLKLQKSEQIIIFPIIVKVFKTSINDEAMNYFLKLV